ncbi:MAG: tetratricopeptide repeat protein [Sulfitobacter sp.]
MSNTDSFVEEVNEEVRRDQLYGYLRRYGWVAVLAIILIVGGAAYSEYQKAQARAQAEGLGDAMLAALANNDSVERVAALEQIDPATSTSAAVLRMLKASEQAESGDSEAAVATLNEIAVDGEVPAIYRQLAQFKAITLQGTETPVADRRQALEQMAQPGSALRLLASEQLALIDVETGDAAAAITRYQAILSDAEVSADLQQRALQVIVALGGEPELPTVLDAADQDSTSQGN